MYTTQICCNLLCSKINIFEELCACHAFLTDAKVSLVFKSIFRCLRPSLTLSLYHSNSPLIGRDMPEIWSKKSCFSKWSFSMQTRWLHYLKCTFIWRSSTQNILHQNRTDELLILSYSDILRVCMTQHMWKLLSWAICPQ